MNDATKKKVSERAREWMQTAHEVHEKGEDWITQTSCCVWVDTELPDVLDRIATLEHQRDALLEAVRDARPYLQRLAESPSHIGASALNVLNQMDAAIAKAEGADK